MKEFMARWDLRITKNENGYRCNWLEDLESTEARIMETVFEEAETEHGEIEAFERLLCFITEHFGCSGSKHDKKRIRITIDNEEA
jgi:hypothetical protein